VPSNIINMILYRRFYGDMPTLYVFLVDSWDPHLMHSASLALSNWDIEDAASTASNQDDGFIGMDDMEFCRKGYLDRYR
jgi:hypothetical protein